jgi:hypothetical protein
MPGLDRDTQTTQLDDILSDMDASLLETPDKKRRKRRVPRWLWIILGAAAVDLAARFFIPASMPFVLKLEAFVFLGAAAALALPVFRKVAMSGARRKVRSWLAGALVLGAIRSGMWGFGIPVEYANLTIFLLGLGALGAFLFRRRLRRRDRSDSGG